MRCRRARKLIDAEPYLCISSSERAALEAHVSECHACAAYRKAVKACLAVLHDDALYVEEAPVPVGIVFEQVDTKTRVDAQGSSRSLAPVARLVRWLDSWSGATAATAQKLMAAVAACVVIASVWMSQLSDRSSQPVDTIAVDRMVSVCVKQAPNGRVYAAVTSRTAVLQPPQWEVLP
ncbi:MAG: hypothetical protein QHI38_11685 [Armatimonadota bacterium]|nr:hypothetical protein [Armatimonadota bacterium]